MLKEKLYRLISSTLEGGYVAYCTASRVSKLFSEQLGLSEELSYQILLDYFRGKYISSDTAYNCAELIYQKLIQMEADAKMSEEEREIKKKRIESLARVIDSELCDSIRGGYVSYSTAEWAAKRFSQNIKIPFEFAHQLMLDYARGKYCSYEAASSYARMMAERILQKYENYPDLQESPEPKAENQEKVDQVPERNESEDKQKNEKEEKQKEEKEIIDNVEEKQKCEKEGESKNEKEEKQIDMNEEKQKDVKEKIDLSKSTSSAAVDQNNQKITEEHLKHHDIGVQTIMTGEIIDQLIKIQNSFFLH